MTNNEVPERLVDEVRGLLIAELEAVAEKWGPRWINQEGCLSIVAKLRSKQPVRIGGPFYGDFLDAILFEKGIKQSDKRYSEIWKRLESPDIVG